MNRGLSNYATMILFQTLCETSSSSFSDSQCSSLQESLPINKSIGNRLANLHVLIKVKLHHPNCDHCFIFVSTSQVQTTMCWTYSL